jgi:hypothetical protein
MLAVCWSRHLTQVEYAASPHLFDWQRAWCPGERGGCLTGECAEIIAVGRGAQARPLAERKGRRPRWSQDPRGILGRNAEPTGTDGFRVLCHQFHISSLLLLATCFSRCNACEASEKTADGEPSTCCDEASASRAKAAGIRSSRFRVANRGTACGGAERTASHRGRSVWCHA